MKRLSTYMGMVMLILADPGCKEEDRPLVSQPASASPASPKSAVSAVSPPARPTAETSGKVVETMNSGGYTYVQLQRGEAKIWAAGPQTKVAVGQDVRLVGGMPMQDFHSKSLDRTFESILFVTQIVTPTATSVPSSAAGLGQGHPPIEEPNKPKHPSSRAAIGLGAISKAEGGFTVAELYGKKKELVGKHVSVRGKVVKFSANIMGKNWIHIQDGTGEADTCDLTVTSEDKAKIGDVVLVSGTLAGDKDIGSGYFFPVIIENAEVNVDGKP